MRNSVLLLLIWTSIIGLVSAFVLVEDETGHQVFRFYSGGAYHVEGFGEWAIRVDDSGRFSTTHEVGDEVTDYGTVSLTKEETSELWALIRASDFEGMVSSTRPPVPDEIQYTFELQEKERVHSLRIWLNDAREDEDIVVLVECLATLIETYTGERPVLE